VSAEGDSIGDFAVKQVAVMRERAKLVRYGRIAHGLDLFLQSEGLLCASPFCFQSYMAVLQSNSTHRRTNLCKMPPFNAPHIKQVGIPHDSPDYGGGAGAEVVF